MHWLLLWTLSQHFLLSSLSITFIWVNTMRNYQSNGLLKSPSQLIYKPIKKTLPCNNSLFNQLWTLLLMSKSWHKECNTLINNRWTIWFKQIKFKWHNLLIKISMHNNSNNRTISIRVSTNQCLYLNNQINRCKMKTLNILADLISR